MQREAESDRGWEHVSGRRTTDEGGRSRLRALFSPSDAYSFGGEHAGGDQLPELEERLNAIRRAVDDLASRERAVSELEAGVEQVLHDGSAELDRFQSELESRSEELDARDRTLARAEAAVEERRRELGAVELKRAALEQRGSALEERESALEQRADELAALARELREVGGTLADRGADEHEQDGHILLTSDGRYRTAAGDGPPPEIGDTIELEDGTYRCVRLSPSPFPSDPRRCAVLERVADVTAE